MNDFKILAALVQNPAAVFYKQGIILSEDGLRIWLAIMGGDAGDNAVDSVDNLTAAYYEAKKNGGILTVEPEEATTEAPTTAPDSPYVVPYQVPRVEAPARGKKAQKGKGEAVRKTKGQVREEWLSRLEVTSQIPAYIAEITRGEAMTPKEITKAVEERFNYPVKNGSLHYFLKLTMEKFGLRKLEAGLYATPVQEGDDSTATEEDGKGGEQA